MVFMDYFVILLMVMVAMFVIKTMLFIGSRSIRGVIFLYQAITTKKPMAIPNVEFAPVRRENITLPSTPAYIRQNKPVAAKLSEIFDGTPPKAEAELILPQGF